MNISLTRNSRIILFVPGFLLNGQRKEKLAMAKGIPVVMFPEKTIFLSTSQDPLRELAVLEKLKGMKYKLFELPKASPCTLVQGECGFQVVECKFQELSDHQFALIRAGEVVKVTLDNFFQKTEEGKIVAFHPVTGAPFEREGFAPEQGVIDLGIAGITIVHKPVLSIMRS